MSAVLLNIVSLLLNNKKLVGVLLALALFLFFVGAFIFLNKELKHTRAELALKKAEIAQLQLDIIGIVSAHRELENKKVELEREKARLVEKLERRGRKSISELAKRRRKLVEKAINNGTKTVLGCIEFVSRGGEC